MAQLHEKLNFQLLKKRFYIFTSKLSVFSCFLNFFHLNIEKSSQMSQQYTTFVTFNALKAWLYGNCIFNIELKKQFFIEKVIFSFHYKSWKFQATFSIFSSKWSEIWSIVSAFTIFCNFCDFYWPYSLVIYRIDFSIIENSISRVTRP